MSGTVVAGVVPVLSADLKAVVVSAVETHLANVTSEVNRVKSAVQADLPSVASTVTNVEALVKAEFEKLKADVGSVMPAWMKYVLYAVGAVALAGGGIAVEHVLTKL